MLRSVRRERFSPVRMARLASLIVATVLVQTIVFPNLRFFGVVPDVGLVVAVAVAYTEGAESGALFGFVTGLAVDLFLNTPFGLSALAFAITAFAVGVFHEALVRVPRFLPVLLTFAAGIVGGSIFVLVGALVGEEHLFEAQSIGTVVTAAAYDAVLAPGVFPLVRRSLRAESR